MAYTLRFFSSKCSLFHNSNVFGSCIIHIFFIQDVLKYKNNSGAKRLKSVAVSCPSCPHGDRTKGQAFVMCRSITYRWRSRIVFIILISLIYFTNVSYIWMYLALFTIYQFMYGDPFLRTSRQFRPEPHKTYCKRAVISFIIKQKYPKDVIICSYTFFHIVNIEARA